MTELIRLKGETAMIWSRVCSRVKISRRSLTPTKPMPRNNREGRNRC